MESGLPHQQRWGKALEKSAEAIVSPSGRGEGPNLLLQGASQEDSMGVERQQGTAYQLSLVEWRKETVRHGVRAETSLGGYNLLKQ